MRIAPALTLTLTCASFACGDDGTDPTGTLTSTAPTLPSTSIDPPTSSPTDSNPPTGDTSASTPGTGSDSDAETNPPDDTTATSTPSTDPDTTASSGTTMGVSMSDPSTSSSTDPSTDPSTSSSTTAMESSSESSSGEPPCAPEYCSDDLTQVLCAGNPVQQCQGGSYCIDAECVPLSPCEAAELLKGSEGCNFWAVKTNLIAAANGSCFAAFVANTWDQPVHINVEYGGAPLPASAIKIPQGQGQNIQYGNYDAVAGLPPDEVAIVFLSRGPGGFPNCPVPAGIAQEAHVVGTGYGTAFRISTDFPVAAYQMLPYGGGAVAATSATLLLPTSVWDTNYIAINAYTKSQAVAEANPLFAVVADEDGTTVTLDPKVAVVAGNGVQGGPAQVPIMYNLNRGQFIQFSQPQELTGSPLASNKRVGMFGGASCLNVPVGQLACDGAHQQIPPVKALGSSYAAVRYRNRGGQEETPPWRLVGAVDGTNLTYTPAKPAGAPDVLNLGQVVEFNSAGPFIVTSQDVDHPFYLAAYMTGGQPFNGTGDPEWVNVTPIAQYLDKYVFFTDPTYPETSLVVIRNKKDGAFADVDLECSGPLGGWQPLGADQEWTRTTLVTGNFQNQGGCSNGRQAMTSPNPFGVTVWGWGSTASMFNSIYVSYAYPAGAAIKAINDVVIMPQ
ncbi:MAG: hypothetical protein JNL82_12130 [Myxococcales bacterium]|nr:hypothetical protein [Myxococcales bacterium]